MTYSKQYTVQSARCCTVHTTQLFGCISDISAACTDSLIYKRILGCLTRTLYSTLSATKARITGITRELLWHVLVDDITAPHSPHQILPSFIRSRTIWFNPAEEGRELNHCRAVLGWCTYVRFIKTVHETRITLPSYINSPPPYYYRYLLVVQC